ncbi:hypothetical protein CHU93_12440 [Sandarakinorhabdus cyanobacteriorum]|uniref:Uncharacterized protein n=2 Tax=Sandarakinorhabdus cyanobacteriorum TaxID=1981098 RepID=A0A255YA01_9SPHN|nr:hypothetical protein CHU93_12440 [Sandarakinorhabdus cyanobacteriorum]
MMLLMAAGAATAADKPQKPPKAPPAVVQKLLDCRSIADAGQRLACFDAGVAALASGVEKREVLVADKEDVKQAKRSLFGLALPSFNLFGKGDDDEKSDERGALTEIEAVISAARQARPGFWSFTLDDGSTWVMTEAKSMRHDPRAGMKVRIRRAAMGSYLANVDGQIAIRVRRVNE